MKKAITMLLTACGLIACGNAEKAEQQAIDSVAAEVVELTIDSMGVETADLTDNNEAVETDKQTIDSETVEQESQSAQNVSESNPDNS